MSLPYGPTIAKRRLSRRLRELRARTPFTANRVCGRLGWGRGKVGRFETNQWRRPEMSDVRDLLCFYEVADEDRPGLEALAMRARQRTWWREYADVFGESEFPGFEDEATHIYCYMPLMLPGLLQTPAYSQAHLGITLHPPPWPERALEARQRRRGILDRPDGTGPRVVAVLTEAPLLYRWGTGAQQAAQLTHLLELGRRPHVEIRLLRFEDGLHPGMCGPINIFDFPGDEPKAVFLETDFAVREVAGPAEVRAYDETFRRIRQASLDPPATAAHLSKLLAQY